jgi:hypothetical protein
LVALEIPELETWLGREPEACRQVLEHLLGDGRLRVHADPERGYRVEGTVRLRLECENARHHEGHRAVSRVVAGGRSATDEHLPRYLDFPLAA